MEKFLLLLYFISLSKGTYSVVYGLFILKNRTNTEDTEKTEIQKYRKYQKYIKYRRKKTENTVQNYKSKKVHEFKSTRVIEGDQW